jgi:hypothetical protein
MFSRTRTGHTTSSSCRDGYRETIERGLVAIRSSHPGLTEGAGTDDERIRRLRDEIEGADAIVVGAGAGLSTAAGLTYAGERFERYFGDFARAFGITDMYAGGFYPFPDDETRWAWWASAARFQASTTFQGITQNMTASWRFAKAPMCCPH